VTCSGGEYDNAEWPAFETMGQDTYVSATACKAGYRATDPDQPTQRLCSASGTYSATIVNPCVRMSFFGCREVNGRRPRCTNVGAETFRNTCTVRITHRHHVRCAGQL